MASIDISVSGLKYKLVDKKALGAIFRYDIFYISFDGSMRLIGAAKTKKDALEFIRYYQTM